MNARGILESKGSGPYSLSCSLMGGACIGESMEEGEKSRAFMPFDDGLFFWWNIRHSPISFAQSIAIVQNSRAIRRRAGVPHRGRYWFLHSLLESLSNQFVRALPSTFLSCLSLFFSFFFFFLPLAGCVSLFQFPQGRPQVSPRRMVCCFFSLVLLSPTVVEYRSFRTIFIFTVVIRVKKSCSNDYFLFSYFFLIKLCFRLATISTSVFATIFLYIFSCNWH